MAPETPRGGGGGCEHSGQEALGPTWLEQETGHASWKGTRRPVSTVAAPPRTRSARPRGGAWGGRRPRDSPGVRAPLPRCSLPQFLMATNSLSTCCESGGRTLADSGPAASAQAPVYCPVYESRLLATARHELNSAAALGVYGGPYGGSQGYGNYVTYGSEASAFYSLVRGVGVPRNPSSCQAGPYRPICQTHFPQTREARGESHGARALGGGRGTPHPTLTLAFRPGPSGRSSPTVGGFWRVGPRIECAYCFLSARD